MQEAVAAVSNMARSRALCDPTRAGWQAVAALAAGAVLLGLIALPVSAKSRPPAPPAAEMAGPDHPGWLVDQRSGCWIWDPEPAPDDVMNWSGGCAPNGPAEGTGTLEWRYGGDQLDLYEGEFRAGKFNGRGKYSWANGQVHDGAWKDGESSGSGVHSWPDGSRYEGEWKNGKRSGQGTLVYANGNRYDGQWENGEYEGQGSFLWANGDRYDGAWKQGRSNGQGTEVFHSGARYRGGWKDDLPDGYGEYWKDGEHYSGRWKRGCFRSGDGPEMKTGEKILAINRSFDECMADFEYYKIK